MCAGGGVEGLDPVSYNLCNWRGHGFTVSAVERSPLKSFTGER